MLSNILQINRDTLRNNIKIIKNIAVNAKLCLPVKANAYGHGLEIIVENTHDLVDYFAVACVSEAIKVRKISDKPILVFGGIEFDRINEIIDNRLIISIQNKSDIEILEEQTKSTNNKIQAHININTGMNRLGIEYADYKQVIQKAYKSSKIDLLGVYSHFSCADNRDHPANKKQINLFKSVLEFTKNIDDTIICHLANSYGMIGQDDICYDMVRPGILSYGYLPHFYVDKQAREIKPALTMKSTIVKIHTLHKDDGVGYSLIYRGSEGERIATIPIGYGDGYFRELGDKGWVSIKGKMYRVVGRISMDALAVSIGDNQDNIKLGDEVELISDIPKNRNSAFTIAELTNTIEYDVVTNLSERMNRVVV